MPKFSSQGLISALPAGKDPSQCGAFGYYLPDAPDFRGDGSTLAELEHLFQAMTEDQLAMPSLTGPAPIHMLFGQFVDHDMTEMRAVAPTVVDLRDNEVRPNNRRAILAAIRNERTGKLDLSGLYGPTPPSGNHSLDRLTALLRDPSDRARMWLPVSSKGRATGPDLLRLRTLLKGDRPAMTVEALRALPEHLLPRVFHDPKAETPQRPRLGCAVIGDPRNDETPLLSELHLALLRFHNALVDAYPEPRRANDAQSVFAWARREATYHYQWLVLNQYLPAICEPEVVADVMHRGAPLYDDFLLSMEHSATGQLPMPLEFSAAAYRFSQPLSDHPMRHPDCAGLLRMAGASGPHNVVPLRTLHRGAPPAGQGAERLEPANHPGPPRDLLRGVRLNLPSAQDCIDILNAKFGFDIPELSQRDLCSGASGRALAQTRLATATPLWFYVLKEAEVIHAGARLGPLGSQLVAGTIGGLILHDPTSYWHAPGTDPDGRWHPRDGACPRGRPVNSLAALFEAAEDPGTETLLDETGV